MRWRGQSRQDPIPVHAVIARHETGAAFMADGYTRETGRLGACCSTTGPGATNLITGVSSAYADRIPMLVITAQTALPNFGRLGLQESSSDGIDTVGMLRNCTRYSSLVSHPSQLEKKLYKALNIAFNKPQGPVHLSIPVDVLNTSWVSKSITNLDNLVRTPDIIDNSKIEALCELLLHARKTVLFLGSDCSGAMNEIMQFAEAAIDTHRHHTAREKPGLRLSPAIPRRVRIRRARQRTTGAHGQRRRTGHRRRQQAE